MNKCFKCFDEMMTQWLTHKYNHLLPPIGVYLNKGYRDALVTSFCLCFARVNRRHLSFGWPTPPVPLCGGCFCTNHKPITLVIPALLDNYSPGDQGKSMHFPSFAALRQAGSSAWHLGKQVAWVRAQMPYKTNFDKSHSRGIFLISHWKRRTCQAETLQLK